MHCGFVCNNWVDHLHEMGTSHNGIVLYDNKNVEDFLRSHLLHWLEALSLIKSMPSGVSAIAKLTDMIRVSHTSHN